MSTEVTRRVRRVVAAGFLVWFVPSVSINVLYYTLTRDSPMATEIFAVVTVYSLLVALHASRRCCCGGVAHGIYEVVELVRTMVLIGTVPVAYPVIALAIGLVVPGTINIDVVSRVTTFGLVAAFAASIFSALTCSAIALHCELVFAEYASKKLGNEYE